MANAGITPSNSKTYTSAAIQAALTKGFGYPVTLGCTSGALNQVWYSFEVKGSVATGTFVPIKPVGQSGSCPTSGITYGVKSGSSTPTATTTGATPTGTGSFSGSGYLEAYVSGSNNGCLISAGTWYSTGSCAKYTATASGKIFLFHFPRPSGLQSTNFNLRLRIYPLIFEGVLRCLQRNILLRFRSKCYRLRSKFSPPPSPIHLSNHTNTHPQSSGGYLTYSGSSTFYADDVPSGNTQETVYTSSSSVSVQFAWTST